MTPRSSCPGGDYYPSPGRKPPAHYEINTVTETAPHFARLPAGLCPSYKLPGSFLASTGGSVLARTQDLAFEGFQFRILVHHLNTFSFPIARSSSWVIITGSPLL